MSLIRNCMVRLSGSRLIQNALEKNVSASQYLMGIGSGGGVMSSGERTVLSLLRNNLPPPYCVFDVGANIGDFTQVTIESLGESHTTIHAFEPGKITFDSLSRRWKNNPKVHLNNVALGRTAGESELHYNSEGSGLASLTRRRLDHFGIQFDRSEKVKIETIDSYCTQNEIDHIHLLKMDIEGHELDALRGATAMLDAAKVDMVTFEFGGCNIDTRTYFQDFWYFFTQYEMRIFRITPSGFMQPIPHYRESHEQFRTVNFVAIARGLGHL